MIAAMQAKNVEIVRVMIEGTFRAIRIPVTTKGGETMRVKVRSV